MNGLLASIIGNMIQRTDSYKIGHWQIYRPDQEHIYSYFAFRGFSSKHGIPFENSVFYGLQYHLKAYLEGAVITKEGIDEAEELFSKHIPYSDRKVFNRSGWEYILKEHGGCLPLSIKAVPEGTVVPLNNALMTVENTDKNCAWLTNYIETHLVKVWYPSTIATQSREFYKAILAYLYKTGTPSDIDFKLHDFGDRGVTCTEQAAIGGSAHTIFFKGTDTFVSTVLANKIYGCEMSGYSINATEHSNMSSWGLNNAPSGEPECMQALLNANPTGLVACVSDTYHIYHACKHYWGDKFRDQILKRDGILIIRPDSSGETKDGISEESEEVVFNIVNILYDRFGGHMNDKGYKVLNPHVRVILGDGVDYNKSISVMKYMSDYGYSIDNIAFGSGGALLQMVNRDTLKAAFKASLGIAGGKEYDIWKDPYHIGKQSMRGRLKLIKTTDGKFSTIRQEQNPADLHLDSDNEDHLVEVFRDGKLMNDSTYAQIIERAKPSYEEIMQTAQRLELHHSKSYFDKNN